MFNASNRAEDIARVRDEGHEVDDDNEPAPENIPAAGSTTNNGGLKEGQSWGWNGVDRMSVEAGEVKKMPSFADGWTPQGKTYLEIFLHMLPLQWFTNVLVAKTSEGLVNASNPPLSFGEMLRYIGLWLLMATCSGWRKEQFWSEEAYDQETNSCPYRFNQYMSKRRFDGITRELRLTNVVPPVFVDKFWQVRQMIAEFNTHMAQVFRASWAICLDESMSIWHNRWTCPGWVFCPRKPHPFGNEYHSACCAISGIMFVIELVEGKDRPSELGQPEFESLGGKTVGLLLRMLKSYFSTGRYVILDSGFCVLKALIELKKKGVYACALIKKRRYWPTMFPGEEVKEHFNMEGVNVGDTDAISGIMDGVPYNFWCMKEPNYIMSCMATGGRLLSDATCKIANRSWVEGGVNIVKSFAYALPFDWHFRYRHAVDDHNNLRHALPSIEDTWLTFRWELRVLAFILALCEVNSYLALKYFVFVEMMDNLPTLLEFRRKLAWQLIKNRWVVNDDDSDVHRVEARLHTLMTAPHYASRYHNRRWYCDSKSKYQQFSCRGGCGKRRRTYCACNPGYWLCVDCHGEHLVNIHNPPMND